MAKKVSTKEPSIQKVKDRLIKLLGWEVAEIECRYVDRSWVQGWKNTDGRISHDHPCPATLDEISVLFEQNGWAYVIERYMGVGKWYAKAVNSKGMQFLSGGWKTEIEARTRLLLKVLEAKVK